MMAMVNNYGDAFPTGQLKPVKGTEYDYTAPDGVALDDHFSTTTSLTCSGRTAPPT